MSTPRGARERHYDILMATDLRLPGGTTASVVEEIEAQQRAGYRTGLLHLPASVQRRALPFAPRVRRVLEDGAAELVVGNDPVHCRVLLLRHPSVLTELPSQLPGIEAEQVVLVANQVPWDERGADPYYDVEQVHRTMRRAFGREGVWAPIGPGVRSALAASADVPMLEADWENIIDLERWRTDRTGPIGERPVIGRHSREHWSKWPSTREDILAAYPDDPRYEVRILGGGDAAADVLGRLPENWSTLPFNAVPAPTFLGGIDFMVYFHHPGLVEAFGRVVLEGLASGAVCMAPPALEPIFGDACAYGTPQDVRAFVDAVHADPEEFLRRSARGVQLVRDRFSHQAHLQRLEALIGPPPQPAPALPPPREAAPDPTVVVVVDQDPADAAALLDELDELDDHTVPVLLTDRAPALRGERALLETVPRVLDDQPREVWLADLRERLSHLVTAHGAGRVLLLGEDPGDLAGLFGDEVEITVIRRTRGSEGWSTEAPLTNPAGQQRSVSERARRTARRGVGRARRHAPRWVRRMGRAGWESAGRTRRRVDALRSAGREATLPVPAVYSHLPSDLPTVLVVITSRQVDPAVTLPYLLERAQTASAFRLALLAPESWIEHAARSGVALETWITAEEWPEHASVRRSEYARERLTEVSRLVRPAAVTMIDQTPATPPVPSDSAVLDMLESAARARQRG